MRIMITPESEIYKMLNHLVTSGLGDQASPSEVLMAMKKPSIKYGVQRMLRLSHILNDMAPEVPRKTVRLLLERVMYVLTNPMMSVHKDR
jgi:hypothetical protein